MKLGLALSGGGAKGAAHIGVLKAFEEEKIKINYSINPKVIAKIKLCGGAIAINVDETMAWKKPTDEQIKNLHDLFCIDVEILDSGE